MFGLQPPLGPPSCRPVLCLYCTISSLSSFWRCLKSSPLSSNLQLYSFSASWLYILLLRENRTHASSPKIILHTYLHHCLSFSASLKLKCKSLSCILDSLLLCFSEDLHVLYFASSPHLYWLLHNKQKNSAP